MTNYSNAVIAYISPGGSTKETAMILKSELELLGFSVKLFEIGRKGSFERVKKALTEEGSVLFAGSPVYVDKGLPAINDLIKFLKNSENIPAVPFVNWGCVTSGIALYDMARYMEQSGFIVAGGLKMPAAHSMLWQCEESLGEGHPNKKDKSVVKEFIEKLVSKLNGDYEAKVGLAPEYLLYQDEKVKEEMENASLEKAKAFMPEKMISETLCTQCGVCAALCPVEAIELDPYPVFGNNCIVCFNCVKQCPEEAILCDASMMGKKLKSKSEMFDEAHEAGFFV